MITQGAIVLGGEESACMSVRGHVPEKDAVLACLLVAELVAASGRRTLKDLLHDLYARVGTVLTRRITAPLDDRRRAALQARLGNLPPRIAGRAILSMNHTDGVKLLLEEESWILVRPSGTEPMVRLYIEATSDAALEDLEAAGRALFL